MYREAGIGWSMVELDRYPNAMVFYEVEKIRNDPSTAWASGFPFYCLRRVILVGKGNSVNQFRWVAGMGIPLLDGPLSGPASTRVVPLGLAANMAFYGGLWALPLIAWPEWRTRRRRTRALHAVRVSSCGAGDVSGVWAGGWALADCDAFLDERAFGFAGVVGREAELEDHVARSRLGGSGWRSRGWGVSTGLSACRH